MHNTISNNNIRNRNLRTIYEHLLPRRLNHELSTHKRRECFVREAGHEEWGVADCAIDDVVFEDGGELGGAEGRCC